jgi:long-chain acyl-CoA synthetase
MMGQTTTLNHLFFDRIAPGRQEKLLSWEGPCGPVSFSSERFVHTVLALSSFLRGRGMAGSGERIAIFAQNRPEWHVADFAILLSGHITVPVYPTLAPLQVAYQLRHSGCRGIVVAGRREWEILEPILSELPDIGFIIHMDEWLPGAPGLYPEHISLARIEAEAAVLDEESTAQVREECLAISPSAIATIVYTSGTTATPKGVMLSHANLAFDLDACLGRLSFHSARQALSVLPLAHVFERLLCYGYFHKGIPIAYGDPHSLKELLKLHHPEVMGCVPRILEKVRDAIELQVEALPNWKRSIGRRILRGEESDALIDRLLAARVRRQLGGLHYFICGGACLDPVVERFFRGAGFVVLQGYGMTETSPVIALNELGREKIGSVGRPLDGLEVRIGDGGEIQTRGPHVMAGYYLDPDGTRQTVRDGWLHTGDLGRLDDEGYLSVTGREKDMLVLSNGKKVYCASVEQSLTRSRLIQEAFVVGEGRNYATALIVPDLPRVARAARERGLVIENGEQILLIPEVIALFAQELEMNQSEFSNFERVKRFCFLGEKTLLDPDLMTPTQKMRRRALERRYAEWISRMYAQEAPFVIPMSGDRSGKSAVNA